MVISILIPKILSKEHGYQNQSYKNFGKVVLCFAIFYGGTSESQQRFLRAPQAACQPQHRGGFGITDVITLVFLKHGLAQVYMFFGAGSVKVPGPVFR